MPVTAKSSLTVFMLVHAAGVNVTAFSEQGFANHLHLVMKKNVC